MKSFFLWLVCLLFFIPCVFGTVESIPSIDLGLFGFTFFDGNVNVSNSSFAEFFCFQDGSCFSSFNLSSFALNASDQALVLNSLIVNASDQADYLSALDVGKLTVGDGWNVDYTNRIFDAGSWVWKLLALNVTFVNFNSTVVGNGSLVIKNLGSSFDRWVLNGSGLFTGYNDTGGVSFVVDATSGNVSFDGFLGINTKNPRSRFEVNGTFIVGKGDYDVPASVYSASLIMGEPSYDGRIAYLPTGSMNIIRTIFVYLGSVDRLVYGDNSAFVDEIRFVTGEDGRITFKGGNVDKMSLEVNGTVMIGSDLYVGGKIYEGGGSQMSSLELVSSDPNLFGVTAYFENIVSEGDFSLSVMGNYSGSVAKSFLINISVINDSNFYAGKGCIQNDSEIDYCSFFSWSNDSGVTWQEVNVVTPLGFYDLQDGVKIGFVCDGDLCSFSLGDVFSFDTIPDGNRMVNVDSVNSKFDLLMDLEVNGSVNLNQSLFVVGGNVGVGTGVPNNKLEVHGGGLNITGDVFTALYSNSKYWSQFDTNSSLGFYFRKGINVVGGDLTVGEGNVAGSARRIVIDSDNDYSQAQLHFRDGGSNRWLVYRKGNVDNLNVYSYTVGDEVMTWTGSGYVGIGTDVPLGDLHVVGDVLREDSVGVVGNVSVGSGLFLREVYSNSSMGACSVSFNADMQCVSYGFVASNSVNTFLLNASGVVVWDGTAHCYVSNSSVGESTNAWSAVDGVFGGACVIDGVDYCRLEVLKGCSLGGYCYINCWVSATVDPSDEASISSVHIYSN